MRLEQERAAVTALYEREAWLASISWTFEPTGLAVDFVITAHEQRYALRMVYPPMYPAVAPTVRPLGSERLSGHQYGSGGSLCLEYSGDIWSTELTGANIIESAFRLLAIEDPRGAGGPPAPSRHHLTAGQETRGSLVRLLLRPELLGSLQSSPFRHGKLTCTDFWDQEALVLHITSAATISGELWRDEGIPAGIKEKDSLLGLFIRTQTPKAQLQEVTNSEQLDVILADTPDTPNTLRELLELYYPNLPDHARLNLILLDSAGHPFVWQAFSTETPKLYRATVIMPEPVGKYQRNPASADPIADKKVGIVGLGSVGSKVALSLARTGIRRFYLLDEDVLLPENLLRHALDYRSVAQHKTKAVLWALEQLVPDLEAQTNDLNITGQENNALVAQALADLGACDIIIDATASPDVFRILAQAAILYRTPLVWGRVFAGGIGGLIARSRPDQDPEPGMLEKAYDTFCEGNPLPEGGMYVDYGLEQEAGVVITASDTGVGIISHTIALLAVDTLTGVDKDFPYSVYLLGLKRAWVFEQAFHVIPLVPDSAPTTWPNPQTGAEVNRAIGILQDMLEL